MRGQAAGGVGQEDERAYREADRRPGGDFLNYLKSFSLKSLEVMGQQEEELRQFSSSLALFIKDLPMN